MVNSTTLTRKGQVTIPTEIRRALGLVEGDHLIVEVYGTSIVLRRSDSIVDETAGRLSDFAARRSPDEGEPEREAFERLVAQEVTRDDLPEQSA